MIDGDSGVAILDAHEVGLIAAHLLASEDTSPHKSNKYVLLGPSNASCKQIVKLWRSTLETLWVKLSSGTFPGSKI